MSQRTPHRIRLRRPWRHEVEAARARYVRTFNRPSGLTPSTRVMLVVWGLPLTVVVSLNGQRLTAASISDAGSDDPGQLRFDLGALLEAHNALMIEVRRVPGDAEALAPGEPPAAVWLEIWE